MALDKQLKSVILGGAKLNLKVNPYVAGDMNLTAAVNVVHSTEGMLYGRPAYATTSTGSSSGVTALNVNSDNTLSWAGNTGLGRSLAQNVPIAMVRPGSYTTTFGLGPDAKSVAMSRVGNYYVVTWMEGWSFSASPVAHTEKGTVYAGTWDPTNNVWLVNPVVVGSTATTGAKFNGAADGSTIFGFYSPQPGSLLSGNLVNIYAECGANYATGGTIARFYGAVSYNYLTGAVGTWNLALSWGPARSAGADLPFGGSMVVATAGGVEYVAYTPMANTFYARLATCAVGAAPVTRTTLTGTNPIGENRAIGLYWDGTYMNLGDAYAYVRINVSSGAVVDQNSTFGITTGATDRKTQFVMGPSAVSGRFVCAYIPDSTTSNSVTYVHITPGSAPPSGSSLGSPVTYSNFGSPGTALSFASQPAVVGTRNIIWMLLKNTQVSTVFPGVYFGSLVGIDVQATSGTNPVPQPTVAVASQALFNAAQTALRTVDGANAELRVTAPAPIASIAGGQIFPALAFGNYSIDTSQFTSLVAFLELFPGVGDVTELNSSTTYFAGAASYYVSKTGANFPGFCNYPDLGGTFNAAGAGSLGAGTYQYTAVYARTDSLGRVIYSRPSPAVSVVVAASKQVVMPVIPRPLEGGYVEIYRTKANGQIFYYVGLQTGTTAYTDNTADGSLSGVTLYTTGGILPDDPCPPTGIVAASPIRAFAVGWEDPARLYFSKPFASSEPVRWNASSYITIDSPTGAITGLAYMDEKLIIFKGSQIYVIAGDGPDATGSGSFAGPSRVSALTGCISNASILVTENGVMFQSQRGIELLDRALQLQFISADLNGTVGSVSSAALTAGRSLARFLDTTNNCVWCYDLLLQRWTKHTPPAGQTLTALGSTSTLASWATSSAVYTEQLGATTDGGAGSPVSCQVTTSWIPTGGLALGFGRLYRLGLLAATSPSTLTTNTASLALSYDYDTSYSDTIATDLNAIDVNANKPLTARLSRVPRQRMSALQIALTWSPANVQGITGLVLELGAKGKINLNSTPLTK